jgi:hypothetical protein
MRFLLFLLICSAMAQEMKAPDARLERARARLQAIADRLQRYVCIETVNRSYYLPALGSQQFPAANEGLASGRTELLTGVDWETRELEFTDRLRLEVSLSQDRELHSWPGATRFDVRDVDQLIRDGPVSTGSFGAHLATTFGSSAVDFQYHGQARVGGREALEYRYRVPGEASKFGLRVAGTWIRLSYEGTIWVDPQTLDLYQLEVHPTDLPPSAEINRLAIAVDYESVRTADGSVLLPHRSRLEILHQDGRATRNDITFNGCREYQAESELVFDGEAPRTETGAPRLNLSPERLPLGLSVTVALESAIQTETAAAGDPISARVVNPVRRPHSNEIVIPAGAMVRGRLRRVEHHVNPKSYFVIGMSFNRLEVDGSVAPFGAHYEGATDLAKSLGANLHPGAPGMAYWNVGTFLFGTDKPNFILPAGFRSDWFTLNTAGR